MKLLNETDYIFDGFMHRPFNESIDGWRNRMPDEADYPSLQIARDIIQLFNELKSAQQRIWELERELESRF